MIGYIFIRIILSILLIVICHYLYNYFKENMTNPIEKNIIYDTNKKYEEMYKIINSENNVEEDEKESNAPVMNNELDDFITNLENS
jgi:hypothetical protein